MTGHRLGILGGGQLGLMMIQAGISLGYTFNVLDPDPKAPAHQVGTQRLVAPYSDHDMLSRLFEQSDWVTTEFEHIDCGAIESVCDDHAKRFYPTTRIIQLIQDKGTQFEWLKTNGFPVPAFTVHHHPTRAALPPFPFVQKDRLGGYDGKGVRIIKQASDVARKPSVFQSLLDIHMELSVIVVRDQHGTVLHYTPTEIETHPTSNMLHRLISPARITPTLAQEAVDCAKGIAHQLGMIGCMAVEFFVTTQGALYVNEIAPRPHNSGHHTIESASVSQFMQHVRAVSGLPVQPFSEQPAILLNLLGPPHTVGPAMIQGGDAYWQHPGVFFHWYGKHITSPFRKMRHVTILGPSLSDALAQSDTILKSVSVGVA